MTENNNKEFFDNNFGKVAGNVAKDIKVHTSRNGKVYAHFSIGNHAGNNTRFFNGVAWGNDAKDLAKIGQKGNKLNIRYHLGIDNFTLNNGKTLHVIELVISGKHEGAKLIQKKSAHKTQSKQPAQPDNAANHSNSNPFIADNDSSNKPANPFAA